jgi:undecaprenyl-diphosphatase
MTIFQSIILGIVQGITEFLPISSSAHLVVVPYLFNWEIPAHDEFIFDVLVQLGTLVAVFAYFWSDILQITRAFIRGIYFKQPFSDSQAVFGWYILLATIPALVIGLLFNNYVGRTFDSPLITAIFLLGTSALLVIAERIGSRERTLKNINWKDALWIGSFQALALFPGISRSGATISGGMMRNLDRPPAARFSFIMSIPVMLAAGGLTIIELIQTPNYMSQFPSLITGFITSAIVGYLAIKWLLGFLTKRPLYVFAIYCTALSIVTILVILIREIT